MSTSCSQRSRPVGVQLEVSLFASLCQYFSESEKQWRTDGMVPLAETTASRAVCLTRHLTAFAASLSAPTNSISFKVPVSTIKKIKIPSLPVHVQHVITRTLILFPRSLRSVPVHRASSSCWCA